MTSPRALRLAARTGELARLRRAVAAWAADARLPERAARGLVQAADEAAANAIEHGLRDRARGRVVVRGEAVAGGLAVVLRYRGARFDPTAAPAVAPADALRAHAVHGYGLHLLRRLVDHAEHAYAHGVNELRLVARR